jgi:hypothetical protein
MKQSWIRTWLKTSSSRPGAINSLLMRASADEWA